MKKVYLLILALLVLRAASVNAQANIFNPADADNVFTTANHPALPPYGPIAKWGHTKSLNWGGTGTTSFKSYYYKGMAFRVKFPKTYQHNVADGKKYPIFVFFHGAGEAGDAYDNEYQMYHGGQVFRDAVDNGTFDGFVFFEQSANGFHANYFGLVTNMIDSLTKYCKVNPDRVIINGLSSGGQGTWEFMGAYPKYIASGAPISAARTEYIPLMSGYIHIPIWLFNGGLDTNPDPANAQLLVDSFTAKGGSIKHTLYPSMGHGVWDNAWADAGFWPFVNAANKANPLVYFGRTDFCVGDNISVKMGLTAGFFAYQWQKDGNTISGATSNTLTVTQLGTYKARFQRVSGGAWSDWSPLPVVVKYKTVTQTPPIQINGLESKVLPAPDTSTTVPLILPDGYNSYKWVRLPDSAIVGTQKIFNAPPGQYTARVTELYGCSAQYSAAFQVINANGNNAPDAAKNLVATANSKTSIQLDWTSNPNPVYNETGYEIYRGLKAGGPYTLIAINPADNVSYLDQGLVTNQLYVYIVRAVNNNGAAANSNEASINTQADNTAPTAPSNLKVVQTTRNSVSLQWTASSDDVAVTKYDVYVNGSKAYTASTNTFTVYNLTYQQTYNFTVKARDAAGNQSPFSNQVTASAVLTGLSYRYYEGTWNTLPDFNALTPVKTGSSKNVDISVRNRDVQYGIIWQGSIVIPKTGSYTFETSSDDGSKLYIGNYSFSTTALVNNDGAHGAQSMYGTISLTAGSYPIAITYFQNGGGEAMNVYWTSTAAGIARQPIPDNAFAETVAGKPLPAAPRYLQASALGFNKVQLNWVDSTTNETGFEIMRSAVDTSNFANIATVAAGSTSYTDTIGLSAKTAYYYKIRSISASGESVYSGAYYNASFELNNSYADSSNTGKVLAAVNSPVFSSTDKKEGTYSIRFNGSQSYANVSGTGGFPADLYKTRTVAFWMKPEVATGTRIVFEFGGSDNGLAVRMNGANLEAGIASANVRNTISAPFGALQWRHVAVVYNSNSLQLYIDGKVVASNNALSFSQVNTSTNGSRLAYYNGTTAFNANPTALFQGSIDDFNVLGTAADSVMVNALKNGTFVASSAITGTLPAIPGTPSGLSATGVSPSATSITWKDNATNETGFEIYRSLNTNTSYRLLATVAAATGGQVNYTDSSLFANSVYYYKVRALGQGGNSVYSNEDSAKTLNTNPVVSNISNFSMKFGTQKTVMVSALDVDGDAVTLSVSNLPSFATFSNTGSGTGQITFSPSVNNQGSFTNIKLTATDPLGATGSAMFNFNVNSNNPPTINPVTNVVGDEGSAITVPVTASDMDNTAGLTLAATGLPVFGTLADNGNGNGVITFNPGYGAAGVYTINVKVQDDKGDSALQSFTVTINDKNPNQKFLVNEQYSSIAPSPWNNMTGTSISNLKTTDNVSTSVGVQFSTPGWWQPYNLGATTGNNSGVYPDDVMRDYYYFGIYGGPETVDATVSGLKPGGSYNFKFFGSSAWTGVPDNGTTIYTIGSQSVPLNVQNNTQNTANITGAVADASGNIVFTMSKAPGAPLGFLNAFEFESLYNDGTAPLKATNVTASLVAGGVQIGWKDVAYNEKRYDVYRSTDSLGTYTLLNPAAVNAGSVTYNDSTIAAITKYYYKIQAANDNGVSDFSDVVSIVTTNNSPRLSAIANVVVKAGTVSNIAVSVTDDAGEVVTVKGNLPSFATLQNLGNGSYNIVVAPANGNLGVFNASITATDNFGASTSSQFQVIVNDKNSTSVFVNFGSDTAVAAQPWNNILGYPYATKVTSNLKDETGNTTGINLTYVDGWTGYLDFGFNTGSNSGIFPDAVLKSSIYEASTSAKHIQIGGLDVSKRYNIVVLGSVNAGFNASSTYTIGTQSVQLNASFNSSKSVQLNGLQPDATGSLTLTITKDAAATYGYLNALVIQSYDTTVGILSPKDVVVEAVHNSKTTLNIQWSDRSNNETGMEVWRATSANGPFASVATLPVNSTSYSDQGLNPNTRYFYEIRAVNSTLQSDFSNIASAVTPNSNVLINLTWHYPTAILPWNNTAVNPQVGDRYANLIDGQLNNTGMALSILTNFNGEYYGGMSSGNNSELFPDSVMISNYWVDQNQVAKLKLDGLDQSKKYRIGFEGSSNWSGDMTATMTINGKTAYLNTFQNTSKVVYIDNIVPTADGEIGLNFSATGSYGFIGAIVVQSYTDTPDSSTATLSVPASQLKEMNSINTVVGSTNAINRKDLTGNDHLQNLRAYPNPFVETFHVTFDNLSTAKKVTVEVYNLAGASLYRRDFDLAAGSDMVTVNMPVSGLAPGIYMAKVYENGIVAKVFKLLKMKK